MNMKEITKKILSNQKIATARPYVNHSVEFKKNYTIEDRFKMMNKVGLNVFFFPSEMITGCDFLSDSGTTTMTNKQWAQLLLGDEAYGSNRGYFLLAKQVQETFGKNFFTTPPSKKPNAFIFHQGRSCEDVLFKSISTLGKDLIIPSNGHFDTTEANIESNHIQALNLFSNELRDNKSKSLFKGNINIAKLKNILKKDSKHIPLIYITITNNTGGGQPVSLANIKQASKLAHDYKIPLFFDACRFAENAWFIQKNEQGYKNKSIISIVHEMFSYADGFTISFKKDGLVNMGGGIFIRNNGLFIKKYPKLLDAIINHQIIKEGHPTYGGLSGRDIMALVEGLKTITEQQYLDYRIGQVIAFGQELNAKKVPILNPIGGHAVYLDMNRFFSDTHMLPENFGGISFTALLLTLYGHRACELGYFAFGKYDPITKKEIHPEVNFVRFAVPRLRYEKTDLDATAQAVSELYKKRKNIPAVEITYGRELALRHFKARFRFTK